MGMNTNTISAIAAKPITGITLGLGASILTWIGAVTSVLGCLAALVGLAAATYSLIHNRNLVKADNKKKEYYKTLFNKK